MSVLLVNPPLSKYKDKYIESYTPLGLLSIAVSLERMNVDTKIIDMRVDNLETSNLLRVLDGDTRIIGITSFTSNLPVVLDIACKIKEHFPDKKIILGGYHATFKYLDILNTYPFVDAVVRGEGETAFCVFAKKYIEEGKILPVKGISFKQKGKPLQTRLSNPPSLTTLPAPSFDKIRLDKYDYVSLQFSRGCLFNCIFCQVHAMEGYWRCKTVQQIINEIKLLVETYGVKEFVFVDNLFTSSPTIIADFASAVKKEKLEIRFSCDARVDTVNEKTLQNLYDAGCRSLFFGIESGNKESLRIMRKGISPLKVIEAIKNTKKHGIAAVGSFIIGFPWETKERIRTTIDFATNLPLDIVEFSFAVPLPGTKLENMLSEFETKIFTEDYSRWDGQTPIIETKNLSAEDLVNLYLEALDKSIHRKSAGSKAVAHPKL